MKDNFAVSETAFSEAYFHQSTEMPANCCAGCSPQFDELVHIN